MLEQAIERTVGALDAERIQALRQVGVPKGIVKIRLLMLMFNLSLRDICNGAGRSISRSQLHRILHGQPATACERRAMAAGINECLRTRCDSAYLFGD
jgi:hypothetical protein